MLLISHRMITRTIAATIGALTTVGLFALVLPTTVTPRSYAASTACLDGGDYGTVGMTQVDAAAVTSRGTRSSVRVISPSTTDCQHVASVYIDNGRGGFEFGYVIGYSQCPGYTNHFYIHPHRFWWAYKSNGALVGCRVFAGNLPEASYQTFRASDTDADYYWGAWYNGSNLTPNGVPLDFHEGVNVAAMERATSSDPGYARFNAMSEYHDGNAWSVWDDLSSAGDNDPDYHLRKINPHTGVIEHD